MVGVVRIGEGRVVDSEGMCVCVCVCVRSDVVQS